MNENNNQAVFSPEMVKMINSAYESAVVALGIKSTDSDQRVNLAKFILNLAKAGETSEAQLMDGGLAAMRRFNHLRERAHQIWLEEGQPEGQNDEHWRRAEQELESAADKTGEDTGTFIQPKQE